jgi:adenylate cyclase
MGLHLRSRVLAVDPSKGMILAAGITLAGLILAMTPFGHSLEEDLGLTTLFRLRGPIPAPEQAVVVSIDEASARQLDMPGKPRLWPRALHAELVMRLNQNGAAAIFFDVMFEEQRDPANDRQFARALQEANNVILFQYRKREIFPITAGDGTRISNAQVETLVSPIPLLAESAFGLAPFPLPKVPARVNHFVLFVPELGDAPTMPMVALQAYCLPAYDDLIGLLREYVPSQIHDLPLNAQALRRRGSMQEAVQSLRQVFLSDPELADRLLKRVEGAALGLEADRHMMLVALIRAYGGPGSAYLNFYGPPRSITTIPYHTVLDADRHDKAFDIAGRMVFVGYSAEWQPDQQDGFYTVFTSRRSGMDISGVEIGATAFANLLTGQLVRVPGGWIDVGLLVAWSILLGVGLRLVPGAWQIPAALGLALAYLLLAYQLFTSFLLWPPLAVPLLWQWPLATGGTMFWRYLDVRRERRNIRRAFGYHLPVEVVDRLAEGIHPLNANERVHGIVLATDASKYTTLSERLTPAQLHKLVNEYYASLFVPIREAGGVVSDVIGDAALAIWTADRADPEQRRQACHAALDACRAVDLFNLSHKAAMLPTRMGLHCGEVVIGHVGAVDHYEYRAVGDIVNTATRIEGLNKELGTRILASRSVVDGLNDIRCRELGRFMLAGKTQPLTLYELIDAQNETAGTADTDQWLFHNALQAFQAQRWRDAAAGFEAFVEQHGPDGPSRYFLNLCQIYDAHPPADWDGVIRVTNK